VEKRDIEDLVGLSSRIALVLSRGGQARRM